MILACVLGIGIVYALFPDTPVVPTPTPSPTPEPTVTPTPRPDVPMLTDLSGSGNDAFVFGTRLVQAPGGKARSFNGATDYAYAANSASLSAATGLSVEVLFRADHIGGVQTLASKSWSSKSGEGYTLWIIENMLEFLVYDGSGTRVDLDYSPGLTEGQWYHLVATADGSTLSLYVDGHLVASKPCSGLKSSSLDLTVGRTAPRAEAFLTGQVATMRIYSRSLSPSEVTANYNLDCARAGLSPVGQAGTPSTPVANGLVLWYDLGQPVSGTDSPDTTVTTITHPFLTFNDVKSTPGYQHRATSPWKDWEANIIAQANNALSANFHSSSGAYEAQRGIYAQQLGMAYQITGDTKYAARAKEALLNMGSTTRMGSSGMMSPEGFRAISLLGYCLAYDWIQPTLDASTDAAIRDRLAKLADTVYYECYSRGPTYIAYVDDQGQAYPVLGIAGVLLADYTNPGGISLNTMPADWRRAATDYMFLSDKLHTDNHALIDYEVDPAGNDLLGAYKLYVIDDMAWWAQVYTRYYGKNFFDVYPLAKAWMTAEVRTNLPDDYSSNFITNGNTRWNYQRGIVNLLDPANQSYVLNLLDKIDRSSELKYSTAIDHVFYVGQMPDALLYSFFGDYSSVARTNPPYTSVLQKDSTYQVFRENWQQDSDWLALITFNKDIPTASYRNMNHHDQMSFEYYAKGDLLLADAGEDRYSTDNYKGEYEVHHNTIAIENPRSSFGAASWSGSPARGIFKATKDGIVTPSYVRSEMTSAWMDLIDVDTTIKAVIDGSSESTTSLSSPIQYERAVLYPEKDYFIVIDRLEGTQPWVYRNIFRPTSFSIVPSSGGSLGHVIGDLRIDGGQSYNWESLGYKRDTSTGITTNSVYWGTTSVYGNSVDLQIFTVPASPVYLTKQIGRIGGYDAANEVYNPVVYFRTPAQNSLYRATVLLPRYTSEAAKAPSVVPVTGTGNAMKVSSPGYDDYVYTGKGTSSFGGFATNANTVFVRVAGGRPTDITMIDGTQLDRDGKALAYTDVAIGVLSVKIDGSTIRIDAPDHGKVKITLCQLDTSVKYQVEVNGASYGSPTVENGRISVTLS